MNRTLPTPPVALVEHEPLARHTSWRIGGPARYYAELRSPDEASALARWAAAAGLPLIWLGGGTNLLVRDSGFPGVAARYRAQAWQIDEQGASALLQVEAGAPMAGTARRVGALGWAGMEWAEGVPGTIGGAVFGNAGCYGGDTAGLLQTVRLLVADQIETWPVTKMGYAYRTSALKEGGPVGPSGMSHAAAGGQPPALILAADLRLSRGDPAALAERMRQIAAERKSKTPWGSSCGSVFKNPPGSSAGQLIEQAGLKGRQIGGAAISERHANYIVNRGGASSDDVLALVELARAEVGRQFGVELALEVRVVG